MVSLGGTPNRRGGGGGAMSFDDRSVNGGEDAIHENTPLIDGLEPTYRRISTTPYIVLHIILTIAFVTMIVLFPTTLMKEKCDKSVPSETWNNTGYSIALYIHAGSYPISVIFDRIYHHYQDLSRRDGYLEFYRQTRNLRRTPLFIVSTGNAMLVAFILLMERIQASHNDCKVGPLEPYYYLIILAGVETLINLIALIWYLIRTIQFNRKRARPDATEDDFLSTFMAPQIPTNELGFQDETYRENVLEKQGDLIRYLHERNEELTRRIFQCSQQMNNFSRIGDRRL